MLLMTIGTLSLVSCEGVDPEDSSKEDVKIALSVDPESINFTAEGGSEGVTVTTDAENWDYMVAASWLEVERFEGGKWGSGV